MLDAHWNTEAKLWYVPQGVDAKPFEKWFSSVPISLPNMAPALATAKPFLHNNTSANPPLGDDTDAIISVLQYGLCLLPDLYEGFNPMTYDEAAVIELEIGIDLRSAGFGVWQA